MSFKRLRVSVVVSLLLLAGVCSTFADLIYNNSSSSGYYFDVERYTECLDYGRSSGGIVTSFTIGYYADSSSSVSVKVRFYKYTDYSNIPGSNVRVFTLSMPGVSGGGLTTYTYTVPEMSRFELPSGDLGYSVEFTSFNDEPMLAGGGTGNENVIMYFDEFIDMWRPTYFNNVWAGLYMKIYATEPETCDFSGYVYEDINEDGQKDFGDNPLQGWKIFADYDGDRELDSNEPYDVSASDGSYDLGKVDMGSYDAICQVTKDGWKPINPEEGFYQIWVSADGSYTLDFGNKEIGMADISGYKFEDIDADGIWDVGEPTLPGWMIFLDENDNGLWESGEPNAITDPNGFYEFVDIEAPASYTITEQMQDGWWQTLPGGTETYEVAVEPNDMLRGYDFGNTTEPQDKTVTISGRVVHGTGRLEGVLVEATHVDPISNGGFYIPEPVVIYDSTLSGEDGYYELIVPIYSTCAVIADDDNWSFYFPTVFSEIAEDQTYNIAAYWPYSGGLGTSYSPFKISNVADLEAIGEYTENSTSFFVMTNDIDLTGKEYLEPIIPTFAGVFDGVGFSILNLRSNNGVFGTLENGVIKNLGVENVDIGSPDLELAIGVGAVCNMNRRGTIENCFSTGNINGLADLGGICSWAFKVYDDEFIMPPLPGDPPVEINTPVIKNCYSTVNITLDYPANLYYQYFGACAGGLCAYVADAEIYNNYATGTINATGSSNYGPDITAHSGGLIGAIENSNVYNNYSTGKIVNRDYCISGGLCGSVHYNNTNSITHDNYWDVQSSGQSDSAFGVGLTTEQMHQMDVYVNFGWDFENTWRMCDGFNYPRLIWEKKVPGDITCPDGVGMEDFYQLAKQWQMIKLDADFQTDGKVDLYDWRMLSSAWDSELGEAGYELGCDISSQTPDGIIDTNDLMVFASQWMMQGLYSADIYPDNGDDVVNNSDLNIIMENWLMGRE